MKKYLFCLVIILSFSTAVHAESADRVLVKMADAENVERVRVGRFLMTVGRMAINTFDNSIPNIPRGLRSVEVYELSRRGCAVFRQNLTNEIKSIRDGNGYQTLMRVRDGNDYIRIMVRSGRNNTIRELVFFAVSDNNPTVIRLSGRVRESEITEFVNNIQNQNNGRRNI